MLFNSIDFVIFIPIVFLIYWLLNSHLRAQNLFVAISSYVFYGWWDYRFLFLIFFSTVVDFYIAKNMQKYRGPKVRKLLLVCSLFTNLGLLGVFKYYNFFVENFNQAFTFLGYHVNGSSLNIVLPVGISFYTFQTLSYTIDVYRSKLQPTPNFVSFAAFVSFFPQLVAGPIERATNLLPQFYKSRKFEYTNAVDGLRQILWGLFKKMVIADNCALYADMIFNNSESYSGSTLALGAVFFAFQIYGDFSGYSDIAIGTSRLFGFNLMQNFAFPYFSRDVAEFWRRWHISLSTWFRDYLYIPLGGSRYHKVRNVFVIFLVSGFWHGANWTFIIWGAINALYFIPLLLAKRNRVNTSIVAENKRLPSPKELFNIITTFSLVTIAWVFFRAESISHALIFIRDMFSLDLLSLPVYSIRKLIYPIVVLLAFFVVVEWFGRKDKYAIENLLKNKFTPIRWAFYTLIIFLIGMYMQTEETPFIYFQF
ncbi:MAG: membrane-bound O-acyltransferase family protein [Flavobacteriaceae bacterium]|nr:membrane-bound O-acyltransferase family protein [Flavobacteriaceae bacterium]